MAREAARLGARAALRKPSTVRLPSLIFVTDPARTPEPESAAERLPRGSGVVYRSFGAPDALARAFALREVAARRGLTLLVGADEALADAAGADGLHLPQRDMARAVRVRARHPGWLITAAAHDARAIAGAARLGLDAVLVSPVFPSRSPSAGRPLGAVRLAAMVRAARLPVIALGGIEARTARRLADTGVAGIAAVQALAGD